QRFGIHVAEDDDLAGVIVLDNGGEDAMGTEGDGFGDRWNDDPGILSIILGAGSELYSGPWICGGVPLPVGLELRYESHARTTSPREHRSSASANQARALKKRM
ncbi:MAG: hypothetical protein KC994_27445, partial [Candidatus Omnitrophica bacterium]|nr:hypothetical protein [Candidatus Omnitrophota bacterium]